MKEWCSSNEPDLDPSRCALFYLMAHDHHLYNHIGLTSNSTNRDCEYSYYFDFFDPEISFLPGQIVTVFRMVALATGFALQYKRVICGRFKLLAYCFIFTILLHLPSLFQVNKRSIIDYMAYINQVSCFAAGET